MNACSSYYFFSAIIAAGAILTGFSGTFLQFRIQREANYYRQPVLSYEERKAVDVFIGLSHFTSSFLLIIVAVLLEIVFGFTLPLLALAGYGCTVIEPKLVVSGLIAALIFLVGYFCSELVHYGILNRRLLNDKNEWGRHRVLVSVTTILAIFSSLIVFFWR